jgi:hypothetical protein
LNRAEQLHDQAEFLRSLAMSSRTSGKRNQLLKAAEQCEALAASLGHHRAEKPTPAPARAEVGEPYLRMPGARH